MDQVKIETETEHLQWSSVGMGMGTAYMYATIREAATLASGLRLLRRQEQIGVCLVVRGRIGRAQWSGGSPETAEALSSGGDGWGRLHHINKGKSFHFGKLRPG